MWSVFMKPRGFVHAASDLWCVCWLEGMLRLKRENMKKWRAEGSKRDEKKGGQNEKRDMGCK